MNDRCAKQPFRFSSCMELCEVLGKRAVDEHRLLELIEEAPADSIYYHTHSYYLRHAYAQQLYSNDFANWVVLYAQDRVLGERLGVLDPFDFSDIEQLRGEILRIMADHLNHSTVIARCIVSEPFEFIRSHVIEIPLGVEARTLGEFYDVLADVEVGAVYNHMCEARRRKKPLSADFACWLSSEEGLGLQDLASRVEQVGRLGLTLEGMRKKILRLCDQELQDNELCDSAVFINQVIGMLEQYRDLVPQGTVELLRQLGRRVEGKSLVHVNSTQYGGGVAEMLHRLLPLFEELGIKVRWEVMTGSDLFYRTTKSFHNALQGTRQRITPEMYDAYIECNRESAKRLNLDAEFAMIHDPQPAALIDARPHGATWMWRCHIDVSTPQHSVWQFLRPFVVRYDAAVFSLPKFSQRLPLPQFLVYPSIDPLSEKNCELGPDEIERVLQRLGVPRDKPILLQVSRFDRFKDPVGVVAAYRLVKKSHDCRLVLVGGTATDDPEGAEVLAEVQEAVGTDPDAHILLLPPTANLEINALQRAATIIYQKSTREGFGLTVAEALWKGKPVIGGETGGITVQLIPGVTGFTVNSPEGAAFYTKRLLNEPDTLVSYYRMADLTLVSSVYDGMNLVAKEYVASQVDEAGVLVVSHLAGAAEELSGALVVNPYDQEKMADSIRRALEMPENERRERMRLMRLHLSTHDIYHWAESCLHDVDIAVDHLQSGLG